MTVDLSCVQDDSSWSQDHFGGGNGLLGTHRHHSIILVIS